MEETNIDIFIPRVQTVLAKPVYLKFNGVVLWQQHYIKFLICKTLKLYLKDVKIALCCYFLLHILVQLSIVCYIQGRTVFLN